MKTFKQFTNESKKLTSPDDIEQGAVVDGIPSAYVQHGSHAFNDNKEDGDVVDGVPFAYVEHGGHSGLEVDPKYGRTLKEKTEVAEPKVDDYLSRNENRNIAIGEGGVGKVLGSLQKREGMDTHHIHKYTDGSRILNKALYQAHANGEKAPTEVRGYSHTHDVKKLDTALSRNKLPTDLHVYSGVGFDPSLKAAKHPEHIMHLPAYTSTSIKKSVARNFAATQGNEKPALQKGGLKGHILHIHLKKGHAGAYIDHESAFKGEGEFLLPRAKNMKITHHSDHEDDFSDTYRVHHAVIVP